MPKKEALAVPLVNAHWGVVFWIQDAHGGPGITRGT
jgi:hypothetical protein